MSKLSEDERRLYERIPEDIDVVPHESFDAADAEDVYFGEELAVSVPQWTHFPEAPEDMHKAARARATLGKDEEAFLFLRYNYARSRLSKLAAAQKRRRGLARAKEMLLWFERLLGARSDVVNANMALVLAMAKRTRIPNVDFADLVSEGNMALLRSVEKFDVSRGFKFSTYACRSILKSFNRLATKTGRYRSHFPTEYDPDLQRSDEEDVKHDRQHEDAVDSLKDVLASNRANLTEVERIVVRERFALGDSDKKRTLDEVGRMVGLTNERVRQLQNSALDKLRAVLSEEYLVA
ncbi:MAG: sigma-70 family RNA polymerase sigma factor [Planctomycetota bacterium]